MEEDGLKRNFLGRLGWKFSICRYVSNETEFWNILSVDEWDIVLLDVNLREQSKSSGIDLIETIYSKKPKIKVVMLSSYDMPVYRQEALKKRRRKLY